MTSEEIKNIALERNRNWKPMRIIATEKPSPKDVANQNGVEAPKVATPVGYGKDEKKRLLLSSLGIAAGVALLLVLALKYKWIKL
jgi:hypothetical protein